MKTVGLMGGADYESTIQYLKAINIKLREVLGEERTCRSLTYNLDHHELNVDKASFSRDIIYRSSLLKDAGVSFLVLCDEALHEVAKDIRRNINMPIVHIGESLGKALKSDNIKKVIVIGKRPVMQSDFYVNALNRYGIKVAVPTTKMINEIHDWITGNERDSIKMIGLLETFRMKGVAAVIFTEDLSIDEETLSLNVYHSFDIHINDIVSEIIKGIG